MARRIGSPASLLKKLQDEKEVKVYFKKKDGSDRIMRCTLDFEQIPADQVPKLNMSAAIALMNKHGIVRAFDLDAGEWRSIPFGRTNWLDSSEGRHKVGG